MLAGGEVELPAGMRKPGRVSLSTALVTFALIAAACGGGDGAATTGPPPVDGTTGTLQLTISSDGGPAAGPIPVEVTLTNLSDRTVTVVRPFVKPTFVSFRIVDPEGDLVPFDGPYPRLRPLENAAFVTLAPGESVTESIDLATGYALSPGGHRVVAEYRNPSGGSHQGERAEIVEAAHPVVSAEVVVEIGS